MGKHLGISMRGAITAVSNRQGRPIKSMGYEERQIGSHIVNVFYFSVEYEELGTQYRWQMFVNGVISAGGIIDE